jgi:hypothetical protein
MKFKINRFLPVVLMLGVMVLTGCIKTPPTISPTPSETTTPPPTGTFPPGTDLAFETIVKSGNLGGSYEGTAAQIVVINDIKAPPRGLEWVNPEYQDKINAVDYSQFFVLMAFNGFRGGISSDFSIQRIWQNAGTVYVLAHFNDIVPQGTSLSATNSQYQVVKISKAQITHLGTITFKLLDETGKERATATSEFLTEGERYETEIVLDYPDCFNLNGLVFSSYSCPRWRGKCPGESGGHCSGAQFPARTSAAKARQVG